MHVNVKQCIVIYSLVKHFSHVAFTKHDHRLTVSRSTFICFTQSLAGVLVLQIVQSRREVQDLRWIFVSAIYGIKKSILAFH